MFLAKQKNFKFGTQNPLSDFLGRYLENPLSYLESTPSYLSKCRVLRKNGNPYLGIFKLKFEKAVVIFEIITFKFVETQIKIKQYNLEPKVPSFVGSSLKQLKVAV